MEHPYDKIDGVLSTISGYSGGEAKTADYQQVSSVNTKHFEAIKIEYDPSEVDYRQPLDIFWKNVDPFDGTGQLCDKGTQYFSAIFYGNKEEKSAG